MAKLPVDYLLEARLEADSAFDWYRQYSSSIAAQFQRELEHAQSAIQRSPESWANYLHGTRRYLLNRYPYIVVYRVTNEHIEVVAVAHCHRKPGCWADRVMPRN
jgi:plasmid stabilization system protein ParE